MVFRVMGANIFRIIASIPPWGQSPAVYYNLPAVAKKYGANSIKLYVYSSLYLSNSGGYYKTAVDQIRALCRAAGITFIMTGHGDIYPASEAASYVHKGAVIANDAGAGDAWIASYVQVIQQVQPDGIELMNEPPDAALSTNPNCTFANYQTFILKAADAYRAVKPDMFLLIDSCPFWDLHNIANNPFTLPEVYYCVHLGYANYRPPTSDPAYLWDHAYQIGDLTGARSALENYLLNVVDLQGLVSKGLPVLFTEIETQMTVLNWAAWLQDMFNIANKYGFGFLQHAMGANPPDADSILNSDWATVNAMGQIWANNMPIGPQNVTITVAVSGGGSVSPAGPQSVPPLTTLVVTATANAGSQFSHWDLNGANIGTANPFSLVVTALMNGQTLTAMFTGAPTYSLTIVPTANGTTNPPPGTIAEVPNASVQVLAIPNAGFRMSDWLLDGVNQGNNALGFTVTMDKAHMLQAVFQAIPPPPPDQGSISVHATLNKAEIVVPYQITDKNTGILISSGSTPALDIAVNVGIYTVTVSADATHVKSADVIVTKNTVSVVTLDFTPPGGVNVAAVGGILAAVAGTVAIVYVATR